MIRWSIRVGALLLPGMCAAGLSSPALAQVSAANTIAPDNTVVNATKAGVPAPPPPTAPAPGAPKAKRTASATTTTTLLVFNSILVDGSGAATPAPPVEAQSFSDPLADLATAALGVLPNGSVTTGAVGSVGGDAPVVAPAPAVQFAFTPNTAAADPNVPRPPSVDGVSSRVINTAELSEFALGTAIVTQVSQESQRILAGLPSAGSDRYVALLRAMAKVVGPRTKTDPAALEAAWLRTDARRMKAVLTALAQVGTRYRYAGNKPGGFDCSGLTSYAWAQAGVTIPRTSTLQYEGLPKKSPADLLPGDIVWHPGHVSMYLGAGQAVVDAPQTGKTVLVKNANARSWVTFHSPF